MPVLALLFLVQLAAGCTTFFVTTLQLRPLIHAAPTEVELIDVDVARVLDGADAGALKTRLAGELATAFRARLGWKLVDRTAACGGTACVSYGPADPRSPRCPAASEDVTGDVTKLVKLAETVAQSMSGDNSGAYLYAQACAPACLHASEVPPSSRSWKLAVQLLRLHDGTLGGGVRALIYPPNTSVSMRLTLWDEHRREVTTQVVSVSQNFKDRTGDDVLSVTALPGFPLGAPDNAVLHKEVVDSRRFRETLLLHAVRMASDFFGWLFAPRPFKTSIVLAEDHKVAEPGNRLAMAGKYEAALEAWRKVEPKSGALHFNMAMAEQLLGHDEQALHHLEESIARSPKGLFKGYAREVRARVVFRRNARHRPAACLIEAPAVPAMPAGARRAHPRRMLGGLRSGLALVGQTGSHWTSWIGSFSRHLKGVDDPGGDEMRRTSWLVTLCLLGLPALARGETAHYLGPHPVAPTLTKGMCYIEGPHVHAYAPHKRLLYVQNGPYWSFVGDPVEYESEAPKYAYYGHHPVFWVDTPEDLSPEVRATHYCYITGPHHHWYAAPPELPFKVKGGVHWYVGAPPPWYRSRWRRRSPIDDYYGHVVVVRPVVTVTPPEGYVGIYFGPGAPHGHGHYRGGVFVGGPSIEVNVPSVGIVVGGAPGPAYVGPGRHAYKHHGGGPPDHAPAWGGRGGGKGHGKGHRK
jgi:hypothetical protein